MEYEPSTQFLCFGRPATVSNHLPMLGVCWIVLVWLNWFHERLYIPLLGPRLLSPLLHLLHDIIRLRSQCNCLPYKSGLNLVPARMSLRYYFSAHSFTLLNQRASDPTATSTGSNVFSSAANGIVCYWFQEICVVFVNTFWLVPPCVFYCVRYGDYG